MTTVMQWFCRWAAAGGLVLSVALLAPSMARATVMLNFSGSSSDETPAGVLSASVAFTVGPVNTLGITITNTSEYQIADLYFNSPSDWTGLALSSFSSSGDPNGISPSVVTGGSGGSQTFGADGFGRLNWKITFGSGPNRLAAGATATLNFTFSGTTTGTSAESVIESKLSSIPPGEIRSVAVLKFEAGPNDDSAFGAMGGDAGIVPEPTTVISALTGLGMIGLAGLRRIYRRPKAAVA